MRLAPSGPVTRTFGWSFGLALVGLPFPESILGFHRRFGVGLEVAFLAATVISLMQMMGERIIFDMVGQRMSKPFVSWWEHSWLRQQVNDLKALVGLVLHDVSPLVPVIQPFAMVGMHLLLFGLSANPIPIPIPGNPLGRGGAIALWRSVGIRGGGLAIVLGTLVRLGIIAYGISTVSAR
jgi:hypothetical protein